MGGLGLPVRLGRLKVHQLPLSSEQDHSRPTTCGTGGGSGGAPPFQTVSLTCLPNFAPLEASALPTLPLLVLSELSDFFLVRRPENPEELVEEDEVG
jgi:hypothetical protein